MKIPYLYIEKDISNHPRVEKFLERFPHATPIYCNHYGEIFNRHMGHFRLQKNQPVFILAQKKGQFLHEIPSKYGIGADKNFYFSHVFNCPFDCSYCFLQGLFKSAHFVLFINYEDFLNRILDKISKLRGNRMTFFSGYDGDSLALDGYTGFTSAFLPFFERYPEAEIELRTKSIRIASLLERRAFPHCIIAYSLNPEPVTNAFEKKTPTLQKRLEAIEKLEKAGWSIGLRFDPVIYIQDFELHYKAFFEEVFKRVHHIHSVSLGAFRLPKPYYKEMKKNAPRGKLLSLLDEEREGVVSFRKEMEILRFCEEEILRHIPKDKLFICR